MCTNGEQTFIVHQAIMLNFTVLHLHIIGLREQVFLKDETSFWISLFVFIEPHQPNVSLENNPPDIHTVHACYHLGKQYPGIRDDESLCSD